jgi:hypothetical protein
VISDVYDALVEVFRAYGCPACVFLGGQFQPQHTAPMRVVLTQTGDKFSEVVASLPTATQQALYTPINPRPIKTRRCGLDVEFWANAPKQRNPQDQYRADLAYLDALINQFIIAMQRCFSGIYELESGGAPAGNADITVAGLGYTLKCLVDIPVIDAPWPEQQLSACSETWAHRPGSFIVTVEGKVDPEPPYYQPQPPFTVPTTE